VAVVKVPKLMAEQEAKEKGLLVILGTELDDAYVRMVKSHLFRPELIKKTSSAAKIVYTPPSRNRCRPL